MSPAEALLAPRMEQRILPGLERMGRALDALGRPDLAFPSVLVVGTNGKGSTAALLEAILRCHGVRTGLYTSPHLMAVEERIQVAGQPISPEDLTALLLSLQPFPELSFFETLTCAAFLEFQRARVELAVLEVGMGGRWDATNATAPVLSLLTNVGTDHRAWLGDDRKAIAAEKAAALRGKEGIIACWDDEVEATIRAHAARGTPLSTASDWVRVRAGGGSRESGQHLRVEFELDGFHRTATLPLIGEHQHHNLALALAALAALKRHGLLPVISGESVQLGIGAVNWPGRLQWVSRQERNLLLDGAHNREAVAAVASFLDREELSGRIQLVFACLEDKPLQDMAELLRPRTAGVTVPRLTSPRAMPVPEIAAAFPGCRTAATVEEALALANPELPVLVTGSLRLVGEVLSLVKGCHG